MKQTLSTTQAAHILLADDNANWSYGGARALVEWFEELEEVGVEIELDAVAIRCDFSEFNNAQEAAAEYSNDPFESEEEALEFLRDETTVIEFEGGIIIQGF